MFGKPRFHPHRQWFRDPLSHPDIARMSERERADLPWEPSRICPEPQPIPASKTPGAACQARP
ncbi:hypothetical protein JI664_00060 [Rhodobacter sp. NTK016B]|uniref:hypothetical protein n=1 Tax=Rhodobacter sp. NTK016B TaxID=2759676 RepID=UPI001A90B9E4|nr:hypothetical protein [Rhodobacter sp. NTK016B]MBN8290349.1 hypothetical protein [Rhodobacter sp. NTK016B]